MSATETLIAVLGAERASEIAKEIEAEENTLVTFHMEGDAFVTETNFLRAVLVWAAGVEWYEPSAEGRVIPDWAYELKESRS